MVQFIPVSGGLVESLVERQARVNAACSSLIKMGYHSDLFTINNLYENGYTEDDFLDFIKPISSITDLDELRYLSNTTKQFSTPNNFSQFIDNMNWLLNDEQGKKIMEDVTTRILKKKEISKSDVSLKRKLDDYARMQERKRIQRRIDELKKRQKELETEYARISVDLKAKVGPIYEYQEPSINELRIEAYKLYEEDCRSKGITALPKIHELGFAKAVEAFGGIVKERHFLKFLNDPVRREKIENFFKERIQRMKLNIFIEK